MLIKVYFINLIKPPLFFCCIIANIAPRATLSVYVLSVRFATASTSLFVNDKAFVITSELAKFDTNFVQLLESLLRLPVQLLADLFHYV